MKQELLNLSIKLRSLHKDLLLFQTRKVEEVDERRLSAYDILHLSIHDPRYDWLRKLSTLMAQIDHLIHSEEGIEILDSACIYDEATRLFKNEYPEFSEHYSHAMSQDPHLIVKQAEVLAALKEIQPQIRNIHEMHVENERIKFKKN